MYEINVKFLQSMLFFGMNIRLRVMVMDFDGHGITVMFWFCRYSIIKRAVCGLALSCCEISLRTSIAGSRCGWRISSVGAFLKRQHRRASLRWCNTVRIWDLANWRRVWFSDESRFMRERRYGTVRVYRCRNERFAPNCVGEVDNCGF
jgi:hypothetical protein